jgi:von Willebrand factor type A domain-containing protein
MPARAKSCRLLASVLLVLSTASVCAAQDNKKLAYGILVDSTGSMRTQFDTVLFLAKGVVRQVHQRGAVSIFSFGPSGLGPGSRAVPTARIQAVQDEALLMRTIDSLYVHGGQTTLLEAIEFMAENLGKQSATDRVIILITDGEDRGKMDQEALIQKLKNNQTRVYAIGLVRELEGGTRSKAMKLLTRIATETGGRALFPKSHSIQVEQLLTELSLPIQ